MSPTSVTNALHLISSFVSALTRSHSCLRSTPRSVKEYGLEASGAIAMAVMIESPSSVLRDTLCAPAGRLAAVGGSFQSSSAPNWRGLQATGGSFQTSSGNALMAPLAATMLPAVGALRGNSASICQPLPPSAFGSSPDMTLIGMRSGYIALMAWK